MKVAPDAMDLDTKICDLDFVMAPWGQRESTRIKNTLQRAGIFTLGQLVALSGSELPFGIGTVLRQIIRAKLKSMGLKLTGL